MSWWAGRRGESFVAAQIALMLVVFLGPRHLAAWPAWPRVLSEAGSYLGLALMVTGGALLLAALLKLGRGLTPLPYPKEGGRLVVNGPYAVVRHPMYSGGLLLALGWACWVRGGLTLLWVGALFLLLDAKSRREERWLLERHPAYASYRRRVKKLIPFIY